MAVDPRKRQKQLERKNAKARSRAEAQRLSAEKQIANAWTAPISRCYVSESLWRDGMGPVVICRQLPDRKVAFSSFLLDVFCLGVKDAMFQICAQATFQARVIDAPKASYRLVPIDPPSARKLVEECVAFARSIGLSPHPDYTKASRIFHDIDASASDREFEFGKDGKPLYMPGPYDSPERQNRVLSKLTRHAVMEMEQGEMITED